MKYLRILWLVVSFVVLLPLIVLVEMLHLIWSIRFAQHNGLSNKWAIKNWLGMIKQGVDMNKDFVYNGFD